MQIGLNTGRIQSVNSTNNKNKNASQQALQKSRGSNYDQVDFSANLSSTESKVKGMVADISGKARIRPTMGELDALRQQVADGTYKIDSENIVSKILLV